MFNSLNVKEAQSMQRMENLDACLPRTLQDIGIYETFHLNRIVHEWKKIVGPGFAKNSRILHIEPPVLVLSAFTSQWMQEIKMQEKQIIKKINEFYGHPVITSIRLQMHRQSFVKDINNEDAVLPYLIERPKYMGDGSYDTSKITISDEELARIDATLVNIENPKLKEIARQAQINQYKKNKHLAERGFHQCPVCGTWMTVPRKVCVTCDYMFYRKHIGTIKRVLRKYPNIRQDQIQQFVKCSMNAFNEAKKESIYYYMDKIHFGSTDQRQKYMLAMLITGKSVKDLSEDFVNNLCNKYRSKYLDEKKR